MIRVVHCSRSARILALTVVLSAALFSQAIQSANSEVTQGEAAYKAGRYAEAVAHLKHAVEGDPSNLQARLYLALACFVQWVPGSDTPENQQNHDLAAEQFQAVLDKEPDNSLALSMMPLMGYKAASPSAGEQKAAAPDEPRRNERRVAPNPSDAGPYYYLGVIGSSQVFGPIQSARVALKMDAAQPGPITDGSVRASLRAQYERTIEDGIASLKKCLEIDPQHEDAMSYMNLLLRKKADLEDSAEAAKADIAEAEDWFNKSIETKKTKASEMVHPTGADSLPAPPLLPERAPSGIGTPPAGTQRIGRRVAEHNIVRKVQPVYPPLAKAARVQGSVEFTVLIGEDGEVEGTQLVRGHPLLVEGCQGSADAVGISPGILERESGQGDHGRGDRVHDGPVGDCFNAARLGSRVLLLS